MTAVTLASFLLARITEDKAVARAADPAVWVSGVAWQIARVERAGSEARHIARHDPARVLAECEAKRRIVKLAEASYEVNALGLDLDESPIMRALALPYADHPDYREEWKP